ncbi:hypothetical protein BJV82DRAFT_708324 [Fennellomyces sp. T-0311]|nr:hypothetical protein BJV82DRAFT_711249 [Fennellomyces sp. T-0311]KAI8149448.1 hypothetical protein BJV82DRAFT_708324 [Fennellomyces sp. T-0311]
MDEQQYNDLKHYLETLEIPRSYDAERRKNIRQQSKRYFVNGDKLFRSEDPPKPVLARDGAEEALFVLHTDCQTRIIAILLSSIKITSLAKLNYNILAQDEELISDVFSTSSSSRSSTSPTTTDSDDDLTQYKENSSLIASSISTTLLYPSQPRQRSAGHPRPSLPWQHRRRHRKGTQDAPNNA